MIAMGSHLDTQPNGGRYDGILGVIAAVEVLRTLSESGYETNFDIGAVNWTNEEGARFPQSAVSSAVWAGAFPFDKALALTDVFDPSVTLQSELDRHGFFGNVACSSHPDNGFPLAAHFELHIEQGPILERAGKRIGVVRGAQAYRWFTITLAGRDAHTGTTPLDARSDAILAAARCIASSNRIARGLGALASTGIIKVPRNSSTNTIASRVTFTLDIRHPDDSVLEELQKLCFESFAKICQEDGRGVGLSWTLDTDCPSVRFDDDCIKAVEFAADKLIGPDAYMDITSGAGHDSVYASRKCPTTMIFVPCKNGISHHPEEYCSPVDCALGTQVLLEAVVLYDQARAGN
ncbi:hypothetical protein CDD83_5290 [Cordyceps sp. RAO-2017]|nr:hypothetical protein CDD83_5290 [Cordyceps sp. RAO-2017]